MKTVACLALILLLMGAPCLCRSAGPSKPSGQTGQTVTGTSTTSRAPAPVVTSAPAPTGVASKTPTATITSSAPSPTQTLTSIPTTSSAPSSVLTPTTAPATSAVSSSLQTSTNVQATSRVSSPSRNVITSPASSVTQTSTQALIGLPSSSVVQSPSQTLTSTPAASTSILPQVQTRTSTLTATSLFSQSSLTSSTPEGSKGRLLRRHRRHVARGIEWPGPLVIGVSQAGTSTGQIGERSQPTADRPRRPVEGSQVQVSGDFAQGSDRGRSIFESLGENPAKRELVRSGTRRARMGQVLEFNGHGPFKKSRADLEDDSGHTSQELHRLGGWLKHGVKAD